MKGKGKGKFKAGHLQALAAGICVRGHTACRGV